MDHIAIVLLLINLKQLSLLSINQSDNYSFPLFPTDDDARRKRSEKVKVNRIKRCRISGPSTITLTSPNGMYGSHGSPQSSQSPPISPTPSTLSTTPYGGELHGEYELSPSPSGLIEESHITMTTSTAPSPGYMLLSESSLAMSGSDVMLSSATDNATTGMINVQPATVNNNTGKSYLIVIVLRSTSWC